MGWRDDKIIPDQKARTTPSIAAHDGLLHMVHLGDSSNDIWYATFNGENWSADVRIPDEKSWVGPTLAGFSGGRLHMVHLGDTSHDIWHNRHDRDGWAEDVKVPNQQSSAAPSIAEFDGKMHMVHLGSNTHDIWHATFDGNAWSDDVRIPNQKSWVAPSLAAIDGKLHMVHLGDTSHDIWQATFDGNAWSDDVRIPNQKSRGAPALAEHDGRLHMVHMGDSSNDIWHSILGVDGWSNNTRIPNQETGSAPSLASFGNFLYIVHLGTTSHTIWFSQWDPSYVYPTSEIWATKPRVDGSPETKQVISATGHRRVEGTDPQPTNLTVRLRHHQRFFWDQTLATKTVTGLNIDTTISYECPGESSGISVNHWNVFAEVETREDGKAQSQRTGVKGCRQPNGGSGGGPTPEQIAMENVAPPPPPQPTAQDPKHAAHHLRLDDPSIPSFTAATPRTRGELWLEAGEGSAVLPKRTGAAVKAAWTAACAGGDRYPNNCAHFLSNAFIVAGYSELLTRGARCPTGRPIRAREMRQWFIEMAATPNVGRTSNVPTRNTGPWAVFQLDEDAYWGGHVALLDTDAWEYVGTGWYSNWTQYLYQW
ncbi:hypothetical protein [Arthrobacter cheniae]|uniref:hypothetical protein n=1 Tax=Arthrobacter cheniae TaxID=1258888 RepID=UPI0011C46E48|nr:hypothetical protein [Arthrobacter cheniae]